MIKDPTSSQILQFMPMPMLKLSVAPMRSSSPLLAAVYIILQVACSRTKTVSSQVLTLSCSGGSFPNMEEESAELLFLSSSLSFTFFGFVSEYSGPLTC